MLCNLHKYPKHYSTFIIEEILIPELNKFGLSYGDVCMLDQEWLYTMNVFKLDSNIDNVGMFSFSLVAMDPVGIIKRRHAIKQYVKSIYGAKNKQQINTPVNNAVGWKV
jgi:hypothetical protein